MEGLENVATKLVSREAATSTTVRKVRNWEAVTDAVHWKHTPLGLQFWGY